MLQLALSYDDGPNDPYTLQLLDVLAKHDVKATFFMIGAFVRQKPEIARRVAEAGHTIGNHTYTHSHLQRVPFERAVTEITECEQALADIVGPHSRCFRPPYLMSTDAIDAHVRRIGLRTIRRTSSGADWDQERDVAAIVDKIWQEQAGRAGVVLLHDGSHERMSEDRSRTVQASDVLIARFCEEGYAFVADPLSIRYARREGQ